MNRVLAGNHLATFGAATMTSERRVPVAMTKGATNGFFRGIVVGFAAVVPVWAGLIWLGMRVFS